MPYSDYSSNYLLYNALTTKQLVIAVQINGLSTILTSGPLFTRLRYGDPVVYGGPDLIYGGLVPYGDYKTLLDVSGGNYSIDQTIEPEQGRSSVTMLTLDFIDLNGYMTQLITPGFYLPEILGAQVKVYLGFQQISFPEDYTVITRGRISSVSSQTGKVTLELSDPNIVRRQSFFYCGQGTLSSSILATDTTIPVIASGANLAVDFFQPILGPNGQYDSAISPYIVIGSEIIQYPATGMDLINNQFVGCTRGARGTTPAAANMNATVNAALQVQDEGIPMALKLMLSGWGGPYLTGLAIQNFVVVPDPTIGNQQNAIVLPLGVDAIADLGIAPGDYIYTTGAANAGNNTPASGAIVVEFLSTNEAYNQVIVTNTPFVIETSPTATFSVRSQYDTYPSACGLMLPGYEVDVNQHQYIMNTFLGSNENSYSFYINATESNAKTFLESQIYLPMSCYSLTRFGRMSMQLTHPPLPTERLQFLTNENVLNPEQITPIRSMNSRTFYNEISFNYDYSDSGTPLSIVDAIDSTSITLIGITSTLPIEAKGLRSSLTSINTITSRIQYWLSRYGLGAVTLKITTNFAIGTLIEAGDVVAVQDGGGLHISNFVTGQQNLGTQIFEVVDRSLNIVTGETQLELVAGFATNISARLGVFSPSTIILAGSTTNVLDLGDSFGTATPGFEYTKWLNYVGLNAILYKTDWTVSSTCVMNGFNASSPNSMLVSGLTVTPSAGMILSLANYPTNTNTQDQANAKAIHAFFDPEIIAVSGISTTQIQVPASSIGVFNLGLPILVRNYNCTSISSEQNITNIDTIGNVITVANSLGFVASAGNFIELVGFKDLLGPYRLA